MPESSLVIYASEHNGHDIYDGIRHAAYIIICSIRICTPSDVCNYWRGRGISHNHIITRSERQLFSSSGRESSPPSDKCLPSQKLTPSKSTQMLNYLDVFEWEARSERTL